MTSHFVSSFRQSSPYINEHRGKTFVVMLPGDCIHHPDITHIVSDLVTLNKLGIRLVLVHGARKQIETQLQQAGHQSDFHLGMRITPQLHMQDVIKAVGSTRFELEANFSMGLPDSPMYGAKARVRTGNFVTAMPLGVLEGKDFLFTGKVRNIDGEGIRSLLADEQIVLASPIGYSITGELFNLSFADVAIRIALEIGADKLIAYNDDGPISDKAGNTRFELTLPQCEVFLAAEQDSQTNTYFALKACYQACDGGVERAHVISAKEDGAILKELFSRDGTGTMIYRNNYEAIRRARLDDVVGILELISPLEMAGILVKRSRERLEMEIEHFTVMEKDKLIIGCAALYPLENALAGELACVAMHSDYQSGGRASKLLKHIEKRAAKLNYTQIFVLTTQTAHWFLERGFVETQMHELPVARQNLYNMQRQSKIFVKQIKQV